MTATRISAVDPVVLEHTVRGLVPFSVGVAACVADEELLDSLIEQERRLVDAAAPTRRAEFAAGRVCAHRALRAIDADVPVIGRGPRRQPVWPAGTTGSISHTADVALAVAVLRTATVAGLGVDVEVVGALDAEVRASVLDRDERAACEAAPDPAATATATFCCKEAAFKALYPRLGREIEFLEAHVELVDGAGVVDVAHLGVSTQVWTGRVGDLVAATAVLATDP